MSKESQILQLDTKPLARVFLIVGTFFVSVFGLTRCQNNQLISEQNELIKEKNEITEKKLKADMNAKGFELRDISESWTSTNYQWVLADWAKDIIKEELRRQNLAMSAQERLEMERRKALNNNPVPSR